MPRTTLVSTCTAGVPPPLHATAGRSCVARVDDWEVWCHAHGGAVGKFRSLAVGGYLHLRLWHDAAGVSVLTPSRYTSGRFDVWAVEGLQVVARSYSAVAGWLRRRGAPRPPSRAELTALARWCVTRHEPARVRCARGAWWR